MINPIRFDTISSFSIVQYIGPAMPIILGIWLIVYVLLGIVLSYHWNQYGYNIIAAWLFVALYFVIGGALIAGMLIATSTF